VIFSKKSKITFFGYLFKGARNTNYFGLLYLERGGPQRNSGEGPQEESQSGGEEGGIHSSQSAEQEVGA